MKAVVLVKATAASEAGQMPSPEFIATMGAYNERLVAAGVMRDGAGLRPGRDGFRIRLDQADRTPVQGPFEDPQLVSGYWIWEVADMNEALDWLRECPTSPDGPHELEIRPRYSAEDYDLPEEAT